MADILTEVADDIGKHNPAPGVTGSVAAQAEAEAGRYYSQGTGAMLKGRMPDLVKGAGFAPKGGNKPLEDQGDILTRASQASLDLRMATYQGFSNKSSVVKSFNQEWLNSRGALKTALSMPSMYEELQKVLTPEAFNKSFTAGNLGIGSVYGNTPFNLLAPSRLIYPVYTVYRNKFPRPPGQGASVIERLFTGISGSQTGGQSVLDVSIPELVQQGGTFGQWPLNLPGAGSQTEVTLNVPFRFFGITEQLSWLN